MAMLPKRCPVVQGYAHWENKYHCQSVDKIKIPFSSVALGRVVNSEVSAVVVKRLAVEKGKRCHAVIQRNIEPSFVIIG